MDADPTVESLRRAIEQAMELRELGLCEPWMVIYDFPTALLEIVLWLDPPGTVNRKGRRMTVTALQDFPPEVLGEIAYEMKRGTLGAAG